MNTWPKVMITAGFLLPGGSVLADLSAVDPGPYTAATGHYPLWYQDSNDLRLELCQTKATSSRVGGYMCVFEPEPGFDDTLPMVFPDNWPSELFWFMAEADIEGSGREGYQIETYTAALEAAFSLDTPVDGDQVSFARIRIRASIPVPGTYTITHPYGVETIEVTTTGRRAINMTRDIGIGAPGDYSGALTGDIGPFLRRAAGVYTETNPETGATETFIGDPGIPEPVVGSPFDTNFLRIEGPAGMLETQNFSLLGKVLDSLPPTDLEVERATYQRNAEGTRIEVFASSESPNATLCYRETLELVDGSPCLMPLTSDNNGRYFAHNPAPATLPDLAVVTATSPTGATRPTSLSRDIVDVVKITDAHYASATQTLTIQAHSSDAVEIPDLVATGFGRLTRDGTAQSLVITGLAQPPASVTVKSAAGGADTEYVSVVGEAPVAEVNEAPVAANDQASTSAGVAVTIDVLANDSDSDGDLPLQVVDLTQPAAGQGSVALDANGQVVYTPPAVVATEMTVSFTYSVQDARGKQSAAPATVVVTVGASAPANQPPTAANHSASSTGGPATINLLANATDPDGNAAALTATLVTGPDRGTVTINAASQTATYTPPASATESFVTTFTYTLTDSEGAVSALATVTINVTIATQEPPPVNEQLVVTAANVVTIPLRDRQTWILSGSSSLTANNQVTLEVTTTSGPQVLGTVAVTRTGRWTLSASTTGIQLTANPTVTIRSAFGTTTTVPLNVRP